VGKDCVVELARTSLCCTRARRGLPSVSVVIPCHNNASQLAWILQSLRSQSMQPTEIICVDDGSTPLEARHLAVVTSEYGAELFTIPGMNTSSFGRRSHARNIGTKASRGDVILYLDGDIVPCSTYIEGITLIHNLSFRAVVKGLRVRISSKEQARGWACCQSKVASGAYLSKLGEIDCYRPSMNILDDCESAPIVWKTSTIDTDGLVSRCLDFPLLFTFSNRWDWCASNNLSVRAIHVKRIGYWDENFYGWGEEDMDFAYRLFINGCIPTFPKGSWICGYHLEHPVNPAANVESLANNAQYIMRKFPRLAASRQDVYYQYGII
jgi:glycosyltransferase involved in cell wall biosynthesis